MLWQVIPQEGFSISWSMDTAAETISFQVRVRWEKGRIGP